jgi:hypothetical protein
MKTFHDELVVKSVGPTTWQLVENFYFYFNETDKDVGVVVPEGFVTDFASVPRALWSIFPPIGLYTKAAVIHDYLYQYGHEFDRDRKFCDEIFLEAMKALGVSASVRNSMYWGVRLFGSGAYNEG